MTDKNISGAVEPPVKGSKGTAVVQYDYDAEADVMYLSVDAPRPVVTFECKDGLLLCFDAEDRSRFAGVTIIDFAHRYPPLAAFFSSTEPATTGGSQGESP